MLLHARIFIPRILHAANDFAGWKMRVMIMLVCVSVHTSVFHIKHVPYCKCTGLVAASLDVLAVSDHAAVICISSRAPEAGCREGSLLGSAVSERIQWFEGFFRRDCSTRRIIGILSINLGLSLHLGFPYWARLVAEHWTRISEPSGMPCKLGHPGTP